jgi:hypothetical protein
LSDVNVFVNVTPQYHCYSESKYENLEWDKCLCECYKSYHCYSQSKFDKSWVRQMFM